ncbi:hypothetical protein Ancab_002186, partial [Ancistrocladus abbreviatus]
QVLTLAHSPKGRTFESLILMKNINISVMLHNLWDEEAMACTHWFFVISVHMDAVSRDRVSEDEVLEDE